MTHVSAHGRCAVNTQKESGVLADCHCGVQYPDTTGIAWGWFPICIYSWAAGQPHGHHSQPLKVSLRTHTMHTRRPLAFSQLAPAACRPPLPRHFLVTVHRSRRERMPPWEYSSPPFSLSRLQLTRREPVTGCLGDTPPAAPPPCRTPSAALNRSAPLMRPGAAPPPTPVAGLDSPSGEPCRAASGESSLGESSDRGEARGVDSPLCTPSRLTRSMPAKWVCVCVRVCARACVRACVDSYMALDAPSLPHLHSWTATSSRGSPRQHHQSARAGLCTSGGGCPRRVVCSPARLLLLRRGGPQTRGSPASRAAAPPPQMSV
jgi:hypothetical protein